jgi:elongator complex protein 5
VVFLSFETLKSPSDGIHFVNCNRKQPQQIQKEVASLSPTSGRQVIIIDTLHPLLERTNSNIAAFLSSLMSPTSNVFAICHSDIPFSRQSSYAPDPLALLKYLATTILNLHSLSHILAQKRARDKSLPEPLFGLDEEIPGLLVGMGSNDQRGVVLEMNHRRKSGRSIQDWFFLYNQAEASKSKTIKAGVTAADASIILLQDHPDYPATEPTMQDTDEQPKSTFSMGITEKEKMDRDAINLPYFDAQKGEGVGQGGRILYDFGVEDDFDEEEDDI